MKKALAIAGVFAISIFPTPCFSGNVEQKEMISVTEQLLPQIGEKYKKLDKKEKRAYEQTLFEYLKNVKKTGVTGIGEAFRPWNDGWGDGDEEIWCICRRRDCQGV